MNKFTLDFSGMLRVFLATIHGVIYSGFHLHEDYNGIIFLPYFYIMVITFVSCFIALIDQKSVKWHLPKFLIQSKHWKRYLQYPLCLMVTIGAWNIFHIPQGQWLIWSSFHLAQTKDD